MAKALWRPARTEATAPAYERTMAKHVLVPAVARPRHAAVEERLVQLQAYAESSPMNQVSGGHAGSACIQQRGLPVPARCLATTPPTSTGHELPFPDALARSFISQVEQVIVVEELNPSSNRQSELWV